MECNGKVFITSAIYRHPKGNIEHFIDSTAHIFSNTNDKFFYIIAGDFNINLLNLNDNLTSKYVDSFLKTNFIPCINLPTRFCDTTATLIDHIMVKVPQKMIHTKVNAGNFIADITDHLPNFVLINTRTTNIIDCPYVRLFTKRKIEKFISDMPNLKPLVTTENGQLSKSKED